MDDFVQSFEERLQQIETYLDFLDAIEKQVREGKTPKVGETNISVEQQRILYSSVYLQLYNLVESTITHCLDALSLAVGETGNWGASDLSETLRREWVRSIAGTHENLSVDNRLERVLALCDSLVKASPVKELKIEKGAGGNWDDVAIYKMSTRIGLSLTISEQVQKDIKQPFRDDQSALVYIRKLRNDLAHGLVSFVECSEGVTLGDLRDLTNKSALYLREVVVLFKTFIDTHEFLLPNRRPQSQK